MSCRDCRGKGYHCGECKNLLHTLPYYRPVHLCTFHSFSFQVSDAATKWLEKYRGVLNKTGKTVRDENGCLVWVGHKNREGYGRVYVKQFWTEKWEGMNAHRLAYMVHYNKTDMPGSIHVSHLCHNSSCIEISHLTAEPAHVNASRKICKNVRYCTRQHTPHCMLAQRYCISLYSFLHTCSC